MNLEKIKNGAEIVSGVVSAVAPVAKFVAPKFSVPIIWAGEALKNLVGIDDEIAKNQIFGLTATSLYIDEVIKDFLNTGKIDVEKLNAVSNNLKEIDKSLDKFYKMIS